MTKKGNYGPKGAKTEKMSASLKQELKRKADDLVDDHLKPTFVKPPKDPPRLNYVVDITTKQHGEFFYFIATYCCPFPDAIEPTFEARFARLRHVGGGRFHLAYMRHADKWAEIPFSQTLDESIASVRDDPWFQR